MTKKMERRIRAAAVKFIDDHGGFSDISQTLTTVLKERGEKGITPQAVYNWKVNGKIPHKRLTLIEEVYGVLPITLRPDRGW